MKTYKYIIIGGGMTGSAAVKGIRENDSEGTIAMFTKEAYEPYDRPPLTKGLWDKKDIDSIKRPLDQFHVDVFLETTVERILPDAKQILSAQGEEFSFEKLLLATGGDPIHLPDSPKGVIYYRTRSDYHHLQNLTEQKDHFCIIGGGFIGSELAAALTKNNKQVTMIFPEHGISGLMFPAELADFLVGYYEDHGVNVLRGKLVDSINKQGELYRVQFHDIEDEQVSEVTVDSVIAGIGIRPNTSLAQEAGIPVDDGIIVNEFLQTNFPDVYAAGDAARFIHIPLGKRVRVEHEDNANTMGKWAGLNMSGEKQKYDHFPFFYSDLFDLGYEAIGEINADLETYADWIDPYKKGTVYYLKDNKIRGLIFWNLWDQVDKGCEVIKSGKSVTQSDLEGMFT